MATIPLVDQAVSGAAVGENAAIIARERQMSLMLRAWIASGLFFMALPGTLLGFSNLMAISAHHGSGYPAGRMDGRPRSRADVRMDRQFHSRHRLLFAACAWALSPSCASLLLCFVDIRRCDALVWKYLWVALAHSAAPVRGVRAARRDAVSIRRLASQAAGIE